MSPPRSTSTLAANVALLAVATAVAVAVAPSAEAIKLWERKRRAADAPPAAMPAVPDGTAHAVARGAADAVPDLESLRAHAAALFGIADPAAGAPRIGEFVSRRDHGRALAASERAVAEAAGTSAVVAARIAHGNALGERGYDEQAAAEFVAALTAAPETPAAWTNVGAMLRRSGRHADARAMLDAAIALEPRNGLAWYHLGVTHAAAGELDAADAAYLMALELDPGLWIPTRNPHLIENDRAQRALHARHLRRASDRAPLALPPGAGD